jgi:hypothetical protein
MVTDSSITVWLDVLDNWILNIKVLGILTSYSNSLNTLNFIDTLYINELFPGYNFCKILSIQSSGISSGDRLSLNNAILNIIATLISAVSITCKFICDAGCIATISIVASHSCTINASRSTENGAFSSYPFRGWGLEFNPMKMR